MKRPQDLFSNLYSSEISYQPKFEQITQLWLCLDSDKSTVGLFLAELIER